MGLWNNDEARQFFRDNGLPEQYNDGMREYLRLLLGSTQSLPDLMRSFYRTYGSWDFVSLIAPTTALSLTDGSLDASFTFTRASTGYYYDSSGTLVSAAIDAPRFDYNPDTLEIKGLLIENAATNLTNYSEEADNAWWAKQAVTISANTTTAPDGTLTADSMVETAVSNSHGIDRTSIIASLTLGDYVTSSVFVKQGSGDRRLQLVFGGTAFATASYCNFNLATETVTLGTQSTVRSATMTALPNGWYRCTFTVQADVTGSVRPFFRLANSNSTTLNSYLGDGTSFIYIWGIQVEQTSYSTSYIQTVATTTTRSADVLSITGANFSGFWNATEGTVKVVGINDGPVFGKYFSINDGTSNEEIYFNKASNTDVEAFMIDGGVDQMSSSISGTYTDGTTIKMCLGYKQDDSALAINGTDNGGDTLCTIPTVTQTQFSGQNWWLRDFIYYNVKLGNNQIRSLTNGV